MHIDKDVIDKIDAISVNGHSDEYILTANDVPFMKTTKTIVEIISELSTIESTESLKSACQVRNLDYEQAKNSIDSVLSYATSTIDAHRSTLRKTGPLTYRLRLFDGMFLTKMHNVADFFGSSYVALIAPILLGTVGIALGSVHISANVESADLYYDWQTLFLIYVTMLVTMIIHELAHGLTLVGRGGRPLGLGLLLFYGLPALYCDVTDMWRLSRASRLRVALAGIAVNFTVAGISGGLISILDPHGAVYSTLLLIMIGNIGICVTNLVPFVKFDGYIALSSWLDVPNLRAKSIEEAATFIDRTIAGWITKSPKTSRATADTIGDLSTNKSLTTYGCVCWIFPILIGGSVVAGLLHTAFTLTLLPSEAFPYLVIALSSILAIFSYRTTRTIAKGSLSLVTRVVAATTAAIVFSSILVLYPLALAA